MSELLPRKEEKLLDTLTHGSVVQRREAAIRLGKRRSRAAVEPLCRALQDSSWYVRRNAARALGLIGDDRAVDALIAALDDKRAVRRQAVIALGLLRASRAVEPLCTCLDDKRLTVRLSACDALEAIGLDSITALCRRLIGDNGNALLPITPVSEAFYRIYRRFLRETPVRILTDATLTAQQQWAGLELLGRFRRAIPWLKLIPGTIADTHRFCERALQSEDAAVRAGAKAVLDYLTLARASTRDLAAERDTLLRGAHRTPLLSGPFTLLRASYTQQDETLDESTPLTRLMGFLGRFLRLFRRS